MAKKMRRITRKLKSRASKSRATTASVKASVLRALANPRTGGMLGLETKNILQGRNASAVQGALASALLSPTGGLIGPIGSCTRGSDYNQRIGARTHLKHTEMVYTLRTVGQTLQAQPAPDIYVMTFVVLDRQTNGTNLTPTQIYDQGFNDGEFWPTIQYKDRFKILWTKTHRIQRKSIPLATAGVFNSTVGGFDYGITEVHQTANIRLNLPMQFQENTTGGAIGDVSDNSVHFGAVMWPIAQAGSVNIDFAFRSEFTG